jgi:alditol oxidase
MSKTEATTANWAGNVRFSAARVVAPKSVEELQDVVAGAHKARALGTGHSFSPIADTDGILIATARLPRRVEIGDATVTVSGGTRYGDLARELAAAGWALRNLGSLPHISVAGACATSVTAIELVTAAGELVSVREGADEDFDGHVVALGALGITTSLTLGLVPTFEIRQSVYAGLSRETLLAQVDEIFAAAYSVSVFTTWDPASSQLWLKQRVDEIDGRPADEMFGATRATGPLHPVPGIDPVHTTQQLGVAGPWHERLPHFRLDFTPSSGDEIQTEYFVAREHAAAAIDAVFAIGAALRPALQISEIRTVAADTLWLSPAYRRDVVALHFTWVSDPSLVRRAVAAVERQLAPFEPCPHWGKVFARDPAAVRAGHPRAADFVALAARRDPAAVFRNQFLDTYLPAAELPG